MYLATQTLMRNSPRMRPEGLWMNKMVKTPKSRLDNFSPQNLAKNLLAPPPPEPEQKRPKAPDRTPSATVHVDLGQVVQGVYHLAHLVCDSLSKRRAKREALETKTLELARQFKGFVGAPDLLMNSNCTRQEAEFCLQSLQDKSLCRFLCEYQGEPLFVFPAFLARIWACDYCESEFPALRGAKPCECRNCGAELAERLLV